MSDTIDISDEVMKAFWDSVKSNFSGSIKNSDWDDVDFLHNELEAIRGPCRNLSRFIADFIAAKGVNENIL